MQMDTGTIKIKCDVRLLQDFSPYMMASFVSRCCHRCRSRCQTCTWAWSGWAPLGSLWRWLLQNQTSVTSFKQSLHPDKSGYYDCIVLWELNLPINFSLNRDQWKLWKNGERPLKKLNFHWSLFWEKSEIEDTVSLARRTSLQFFVQHDGIYEWARL